MAYVLLPVFLAVPFHEALETTSFLNAYLEMVSAITTTGLPLFDNPGRLGDSLHLWRAIVGWFGGLLIWISASAVLAPMNLGGFEVTVSAEPGQGGTRMDRFQARQFGQATATDHLSSGPGLCRADGCVVDFADAERRYDRWWH